MSTMFYWPKNLNQAVMLMNQQDDTVIVNGGSDIILNISAKKISPAAIVYVKSIKGMDECYNR